MIASFCPNHSIQRLAVKIKSKSEGYIRKGHPWIFESSILKINKEGQAGDIAIIFDQRRNKLLAIGLYDPNSPIQIKILVHSEKANINAVFFDKRINEAYEIRQPLLHSNTNAYRLVFGENDYLPGLIIDIYAGVAVIKLYSEIWFPYLHYVMNSILGVLDISAVVLRMSRLLQKPEVNTHGLEDGTVIYGSLENPEVEFREYGVRFIANVIKGHKTGYFLDHRHNRHKVGKMSKGKKVLDVFSYAGGFSTHAIAGGAREVISLDISKQALGLAERNISLNKLDANHKTMAIDAFEGMEQLVKDGNIFDIVVVDPPSFAKMAADVPGARNSYIRLAKLAIRLVERGGICVMASCSSRISRDEFYTLVERGFDAEQRAYRLVEKSFHDIDHPISFPEGAYLKTGYYLID